MSDCKPIELESGQVWKGKGHYQTRRIVDVQRISLSSGFYVVYTTGTSDLQWACNERVFRNWIEARGAVCVGGSDV